MSTTKTPSVAGQFYSGDPDALRGEVRAFLDQAETEPSSRPIIALMVPHAAHFYSGAAAAYGYRLVESQPIDTVILFGLSHRVPCQVSILDVDRYQTPLGAVDVDREMVNTIRERCPGLTYQEAAHRSEHSIEVQIPFIQVAIPSAKVVEILMQADDDRTCSDLGRAVAEAIKARPEKRVLVVGSTDMTHFQSYEEANRIDRATLEALKSLDMAVIREHVTRTEDGFGRHDCTLCSHGAVFSTLEAARELGAHSAEVVHYRNSGDAVPMEDTGGRVVGYGVLAVYAEEAGPDEQVKSQPESHNTEHLNESQQRELLGLARSAIQAWLENRPLPTAADAPYLNWERGLFVSLHTAGALRGCLGRFDAGGEPVGKLIPVMASEAASRDPRFAPLRADELRRVDIEISILTPMRRIESENEVTVGKHGLYMVGHNESGNVRTGTLLPQVAADQGWDRITFLEQTCRKAGLTQDAWKDPKTEICVYEAQVFGEVELGMWPPA